MQTQNARAKEMGKKEEMETGKTKGKTACQRQDIKRERLKETRYLRQFLTHVSRMAIGICFLAVMTRGGGQIPQSRVSI